ncbi:probable ubiquitin-like-specific protease 2B [Aristolochia californica]|uniref:probable ubiquitin-like-specific protease 2B n=1 Tax=Aristolochia californica TaxID=171875 RepID=UPI0035E07E48
MMRGSSQKDFSVYEFNEDDDVVEAESIKITRKFSLSGNPNLEKSPVTKYDFLRAFQGGEVQQTGISSVLCVNIDVGNGSHKSKQLQTFPMETSARAFTFQEETSALDDILAPGNHDELGQISDDNLAPCDLSPRCSRAEKLEEGGLRMHGHSECTKQLNGAVLGLHSSKNEADVISDDDESFRSSSPSSASNFEENRASMEHYTSNFCPDYTEMELNTEVCIYPDYLTYGDRTFMHPRLAFFADCIKLEDPVSSGDGNSFSFEWALDDVIHIGSQWSESVEIASVKLLLRPIVVVGAEDGHDSSGIMKLAFAVSDHLWFEKEQKITMLAEKYKSVWNFPNSGYVKKVDDFMGQNNMFLLQHYFTDFDEPCEDVVYPKGDPDAVCFSKRDVKLLEPETFINDTIIDFYIKYLKNKMQPEEKRRFHFFNSFFFRKLADLDKNPGSNVEGRAAFLRVRKWTRKVNIFEKDYIFIPVNFNLHWSLIVVCHLGEVVHFKDVEIEKTSKVPCILHLDSIKGSHRGLKNLVQSYLWEEWKERYGESSEEFALKFSNLRFVSLELPQQENSFDCGLFLLHYVELFVEEAPVDFSPFKITSFTSFLNGNWFPSAEASHKRSTIRKLMCEILDNKHSKVQPPEQHEGNSEKDHVVELLSEQSSLPKKAACGDLLCLPLGKEDQVQSNNKELLSSIPLGAVHCNSDKETTVLQELLVQEVPTATESHDCDRPFGQLPFSQKCSALMMLEENREATEKLTCSTENSGEYEQIVGMPTEMCTASSRDFGGTEVSLSLDPATRKNVLEDRDVSVPSNGGSPISPKDGIDQLSEHLQVKNSAGPHEHQEFVKLRPLSADAHEVVEDSIISLPSDEKLDNCVVKDSQDSDCSEADVVREHKEHGNYLICGQENVDLSCQDTQPIENSDFNHDEEHMDINNLKTGSGQSRTHKRRKLTSIEGEVGQSSSGMDPNT